MTRPPAHNDTLRLELEERLGGSASENRIGIHFNAGDVLHEIWLQQYGFSAKIQLEQLQCVLQIIRQCFGVARNAFQSRVSESRRT